MATLLARLRGLGLRSAARLSKAAYWASWVDSLAVLRTKCADIADDVVVWLETPIAQRPACLHELSEARTYLDERGLNNAPTWRQAAEGVEAPQNTDAEPGDWHKGWQYHSSSALEHHYLEHTVRPASSPRSLALLRSQSGPAAGRWLSVRPSGPALTFTAPRLQGALRRRLHWPLAVAPQRCNGRSCMSVLDDLGDKVDAVTISPPAQDNFHASHAAKRGGEAD